jgi:hypothetical protein
MSSAYAAVDALREKNIWWPFDRSGLMGFERDCAARGIRLDANVELIGHRRRRRREEGLVELTLRVGPTVARRIVEMHGVRRGVVRRDEGHAPPVVLDDRRPRSEREGVGGIEVVAKLDARVHRAETARVGGVGGSVDSSVNDGVARHHHVGGCVTRCVQRRVVTAKVIERHEQRARRRDGKRDDEDDPHFSKTTMRAR